MRKGISGRSIKFTGNFTRGRHNYVLYIPDRVFSSADVTAMLPNLQLLHMNPVRGLYLTLVDSLSWSETAFPVLVLRRSAIATHRRTLCAPYRRRRFARTSHADTPNVFLRIFISSTKGPRDFDELTVTINDERPPGTVRTGAVTPGRHSYSTFRTSCSVLLS
jgi:hypothetical protein